MNKSMFGRITVFVAGMLVSAAAFAASGGGLLQAGTNLNDEGSLQRGAQLYMNYCSACHSLKYLRYSRLASDLGLTEEQVMSNLVFTDAKFGDHIEVAMPEAGATAWFGKMPPDLSLISRSRGSDWVYTYLKSFYLDESAALGWNNKLFPDVAMPNPLWKLQGLQHAEYGDPDPVTGDKVVNGLTITQAGTLDPAAFDRSVRDITAFLEYAGEPAALKRQSLGVWVILFLAVFTLFAWLLNKEYWRDVD
ncbi:cytochrome c1 [Lysobacter sp. A289]